MNPVPISLLIIEDDPTFAEIIQGLLQTLGMELRFSSQWVDSAEKALAELQRRPYDLVLLDYRLPDGDGLAVLGRIRRLPPAQQPAVIMLTGMGSEAIAVEAMKSGAKDYLAKDGLSGAQLVRALTGSLERKRLEQQVARYTEELRQKNAQMEDDLSMAREFQQAFLPQQYPSFPQSASPRDSALRFDHRYLPTGAVGGDFFDVLALSDTQAGLFLCDVMGHGVRAALVTAIVRALIEELMPMAKEPGLFLAQINQRLLTILKPTRKQIFASAFYMVADVARGELRYAGAGHPSPLHLHRALRTVAPLDYCGGAPGPALGVFEDSVFPTCQCALSPGDVVLLFTDGLYEVADAEGQHYGQDRLLADVTRWRTASLTELFDNLLGEIQRFSVRKEFGDDVCLVGMEVVRAGR